MKRTAGGGFIGALAPSTFITPERHSMQAKVKNAVITTAIVLGTIWALRQVGATRTFVDKALNG